MDGTVDDVVTAAKAHLKFGTTSLVPTTITSSCETTIKTIDNVCKAKEEKGIPHVLGVHIEGPYIALSQAGAQDTRFIISPIKEDYERIVNHKKGMVKKWTYAPELSGNDEFCDFLIKNNVIPSIGHSDAKYNDVLNAYNMGVRNLTHFYSAMSTITREMGYRIPGIIEAGYILSDMNVEVIADGSHLPVELLKMIYMIKGPDKICLVTDAMRGATMPDGESVIGSLSNGVKCIIEDGIAKMPDRTCFAGSVATADRLIRTFYKGVGVDIVNAVKMMTKTPARILGEENKGMLKEGYDADIVLFDDDINIKKVIVKDKDSVNIY